MNPEILKEIETQVASLPKKVRDVITNTDISAETAKLKGKHGLMFDQLAKLELETMLVMIGLEPAENFVDNLVSGLKINEEKASAIANDINNSIFRKIKEALMTPAEEVNTEEYLDKASILKEIENPTPTYTTNKIIESKTNLPEIPPTMTMQAYTAPMQTKNIVEQKLSEPTHIAPKEIEISLKKIPQLQTSGVSQNAKPQVDPYKEPLD